MSQAKKLRIRHTISDIAIASLERIRVRYGYEVDSSVGEDASENA